MQALMPPRVTREALSEHRGIAGHTVLLWFSSVRAHKGLQEASREAQWCQE